MDFFASQDRARRKTTLLIGYYVLAVALIVVAVYAAAVATFVGLSARKTSPAAPAVELWQPTLFLYVAGGTLLVVLFGSLYKISLLAQGGAAVAAMLGGRAVAPNTTDADERKLLHVVEEVAIASGTAVPAVFVLDNERGINAFAAGLTGDDAVIGVTRGCVERLNRDELQGVIAHEFSHILNGDMRLNLRLMGVLHGILVVGLLGYWIFRSSLYTSSGRSSRSSGRNGGGNRLPIVLFGVIVMAVGYVGVFFAKLIKSAVSRQREYLADASAVQFTRNPAGIAGALKKIGGFAAGSRIRNEHAEETSHFFFSNGLSGLLPGLMATHPPLPERIRRLDPQFDGEFVTSAPPAPLEGSDGGAAALGATAGWGSAPALEAAPAAARTRVQAGAVVASIGTPQKEHMDRAVRLLAQIPEPLMKAARDPQLAQAVVYGLLLDRDEASLRAAQRKELEARADAALVQEIRKLDAAVVGLPAECRLPLAEIAMAALRALSPDQYRAFRDQTRRLAEADRQVDLFEYALQRMMMRHLDPVILGTRVPTAQYYSLRPLLPAAATLLSSLAHWGTDRPSEAASMFAAGMARLQAEPSALHPPEQCGLDAVDRALSRLEQSSLPIKRKLMDACATCVTADGRVTVDEFELLRVVADALGCPMPPLLPDAKEEAA
jgi:Zn-dependent protease with chaperone function